MIQKYKNKQLLYEKYVIRGFTYQQIADIIGCNKESVRYWIKKHKIYRPRLPRGQYRKNGQCRKRNKMAAMQYLGGRCCICGYNKCTAALEFHHVNPEDKKFTISRGLGSTWNNLKKELNKCVLLCCRCHRECHSNDIDQDTIRNILEKKQNGK